MLMTAFKLHAQRYRKDAPDRPCELLTEVCAFQNIHAAVLQSDLQDTVPAAEGSVLQKAVDERIGNLTASDLADKNTFDEVVKEAAAKIEAATGEKPEKEMVAKACQTLAAMTISIPKVLRMPKDVVVQGFDDFDLDTEELKELNPVDDKIKETSLN